MSAHRTTKCDAGFIPHPECMVASGDCFRESRCLAGCQKRSFYQHQADLRTLLERVAQLEARVIRLERAR